MFGGCRKAVGLGGVAEDGAREGGCLSGKGCCPFDKFDLYP